jgi:hypothetical protein
LPDRCCLRKQLPQGRDNFMDFSLRRDASQEIYAKFLIRPENYPNFLKI